MAELAVHSEIGRLRRVLVHTPGPELLAVTPSTRETYLYDDILDLEQASKEHGRFVSVLERFAKVLHLRPMLKEVLEQPEARAFLLRRSEEITADRRFRDGLNEASADELCERFVGGWDEAPGPLASRLEQANQALPALPNLFFTRDSSAIIGKHPVVGSMRFVSRWPESVLLRTLIGFHPAYGGAGPLADGSDERRVDHTFEGGDVHPLSPELVVIGVSERTTAAAADALTEQLFTSTSVAKVIYVVLPERSTAIHLDMIWTQIDRDACVAHPAAFQGSRKVGVFSREKGSRSLCEAESFEKALSDAGLAMGFVWAGGDSKAQQAREQWASGCNLFAVAPGVAVAYVRNEGTLGALREAGYAVTDAESWLSEGGDADALSKTIITVEGAELVRGGGGPRCMTCPLERDAV